MDRKIIGSLLTDTKYMKYCSFLKPEMIENEVGKRLYKAILQRYQLGLPINLIELVQDVEDDVLDKTIIGKYIGSCTTETANSVSEFKSAAEYIANEYRAKSLREVCERQSYQPKDIKKTLADLNKFTEEMLKTDKPKGRELKDIVGKFKDYYGKEHEQGLRTGFYELDEIINELGKGDVTILGARPAVGKSALALQILCNVSEKGKKVAYFNLEMTDQQILERVIARYSGINLLRLRKAIRFMEDERTAYAKAIDKVESMKGLYIFSGSYTTTEMKTLCKNMDFDLVVIDYLQLIKTDHSYGNRVAEVGEISKGIKAIAMEMQVPVIALSQLNRSKSSTDEPTISDLRESGDIEQDASTVLLMWNIDLDGKMKGLKVEKNRQGELGKVALSYDGSHMKFDTVNHQKFEQTEKEYKNVSSNKGKSSPFE